MKQIEDQFNEVRDKVCEVIQGFIMNKNQDEKVAQHYRDKIDVIYTRITAELERVLVNPPADNNKDFIFKKEDCKNTKDSPDTAPDDSSPTQGIPPTVAPVNPLNTATPSCVSNPTTPIKDFHEDELKKALKFFCDGYVNSIVLDSIINVAETIISGEISEPYSVIDIARLYTDT